MPRKNVKDDLLRVIRGDTPTAPLLMPVALDQIAAREAGLSYRQYSNEADAALAAWNFVIEKYDLDAALIFIDDYFEYEAFGIELTDELNDPKAAKKHVPAEHNWFDNARLPTFKEARFPMRMELVKRLKDKWGDSLLIGVSVAAPFTGVNLLYGIPEAMLLFYEDEELLRNSIKLTAELSVECSRLLIESGADIIWYGDCAASSRFIDLGKFDDFAFDITKDSIKRIKEFGGIVVYHAGEKAIPFIKRTSELGCDIISCAEKADIYALYDAAAENCCVMGNLDPIIDIMNGNPESIEKLVRDQRLLMADRKRYIMNTGEGVTEATPLENVDALFSALRRK